MNKTHIKPLIKNYFILLQLVRYFTRQIVKLSLINCFTPNLNHGVLTCERVIQDHVYSENDLVTQ